MPSFGSLQVETAGAVGRITLARPERLNALDLSTLRALGDAARHFDAQRAVRVVVITGVGRAFSVGADLKDFAALLGGGQLPGGDELRELARTGQRMVDAIAGMKAVTVASVRGHAVGGGFLLMAACDLRVVADDTVMSIPELDLGIPLSWGGVPRLVRALGEPLACDLIMTCRRFGPADLAGTGFLSRVVSPDRLDAETEALVLALADKPALPLQMTKRQLAAVGAESLDDAELFSEAVADPGFLAAAMRALARRR